MTAKSLALAAQLFARSIFRQTREGQEVLPEKSNTAPKMNARKLAADHWRYVRGVLLRHGVMADEVSQIGEAYLTGFLRGWALAWYSRLFGVDANTAADWEWLLWASSRAGHHAECSVGSIPSALSVWCYTFQFTRKRECCAAGEHFREAFFHGWKHRMEVVG